MKLITTYYPPPNSWLSVLELCFAPLRIKQIWEKRNEGSSWCKIWYGTAIGINYISPENFKRFFFLVPLPELRNLLMHFIVFWCLLTHMNCFGVVKFDLLFNCLSNAASNPQKQNLCFYIHLSNKSATKCFRYETFSSKFNIEWV